MKSMHELHRAQLEPIMQSMGLAAALAFAEEHARAAPIPGFGIHAGQAAAVMSDMGCHCLAVGLYA